MMVIDAKVCSYIYIYIYIAIILALLTVIMSDNRYFGTTQV